MSEDQERREEREGPLTSRDGAAGAMPWRVYAGRVEAAAEEVGPPSRVRGRLATPTPEECFRNGHAGPCRSPACPFRVLPLDGPPSSGSGPRAA